MPIGILGTVWSVRSLRELGERTAGRLDWAGTLTFGIGLTVLLVGITYGIQPYGESSTGWTNPWVLGSISVGLLLLVAFCFIELHVPGRWWTSGCSARRRSGWATSPG